LFHAVAKTLERIAIWNDMNSVPSLQLY